METVKLPIKDVCTSLSKDGLTYEAIGNLIGVSRLQVANYISGKTKDPRPTVCFKVFKNVIIDNKKVLTGPYIDETHLENTMKMLRHE